MKIKELLFSVSVLHIPSHNGVELWEIDGAVIFTNVSGALLHWQHTIPPGTLHAEVLSEKTSHAVKQSRLHGAKLSEADLLPSSLAAPLSTRKAY